MTVLCALVALLAAEPCQQKFKHVVPEKEQELEHALWADIHLIPGPKTHRSKSTESHKARIKNEQQESSPSQVSDQPSKGTLEDCRTHNFLQWCASMTESEPATQSDNVRRTYPVADLVVPISYNWHGPEKHAPRVTKEAQLIELITNTVQPGQWTSTGGNNTIQYFPMGMGLVVNAPKAVQDEIADLLADLRRLQDVQVSVQIRVISVSPDSLGKLGRDLTAQNGKGYVTLDAKRVTELMQNVERNPACTILSMPKVTVFNGQRALVQTLNQRVECVGVKKVPVPNGFDRIQQFRTLKDGLEIGILPVTSAKNKSIRTRVTGSFFWVNPSSGGSTAPGTNIMHQERLPFDRRLNLTEGQTAFFVCGSVKKHIPATLKQTAWGLLGGHKPMVQQRILLVLVTPQRIVEKAETVMPSPKTHNVSDSGLTLTGAVRPPAPYSDKRIPVQSAQPKFHYGRPSKIVPLNRKADGIKAIQASTQQFSANRTQVRFTNPPGMHIRWYIRTPDGKDTYSNKPIEAPGRYNFRQGAVYRLKLNRIPKRPGLEVYPTLEVVPAHSKTATFLTHSVVPISFTDQDFQHVENNNFVVKVIYLPNRDNQDVALFGVGEISSTQLEAGEDPIEVARRLGSILAVIRMGNIDQEALNTPSLK